MGLCFLLNLPQGVYFYQIFPFSPMWMINRVHSNNDCHWIVCFLIFLLPVAKVQHYAHPLSVSVAITTQLIADI